VDSGACGPERLREGTTVAPLPSRLKTGEVAIERASRPNLFQSQWLIWAYEKIVPSSTPTESLARSPASSIEEVARRADNMKEIT